MIRIPFSEITHTYFLFRHPLAAKGHFGLSLQQTNLWITYIVEIRQDVETYDSRSFWKIIAKTHNCQKEISGREAGLTPLQV